MSEFVTVIPTTGAISVAVNEDYVSIQQENTMGERADIIGIPRPLFREVLSSIFLSLDPHELREIAELAEAHSMPSTGG